MSHTSRIRTPFKQHLHRFRLTVLPAISFFLCVLLTLWLWQRQAVTGTVVGEVEARQFDVIAGIDGRMLALPDGRQLEMLDHVTQGQVIAYLDNRGAEARLRAVQAEAATLEKELDEAKTTFELDKLRVLQQHQQDAVRLQWEVERRRVELLQLQAELQTLKSQLTSVQRTLSSAERGPRLIDVGELTRERDALQGQIAASEPLYRTLQAQYEAAQQQLDQQTDLKLPDVEAVLAPVRAAVAVQEALADEIKAELDSLVIRSPIDGVITAIYRRPGQQVVASDLIVSIAAPDSNYVVGYVREQQRIALYEGMEVGLRLRSQPGGTEYTSTVEVVGPQLSLMPPRQLNDQAVLEWGIPIRIPIPTELRQQDLRPGQLVQVIFRSPRTQ